MKNMWNERYAHESYAYGIDPNDFFKKMVDNGTLTGEILKPTEGEGRNAVYASKNGLDVTAFDLSEEGKKKALKLAKIEQVEIKYEVGEFFKLPLIKHTFDSAALIYAHFPPQILSSYYKKIGQMIRLGGHVVIEGFSLGNLELREKNTEIGGPDNPEMLFTVASIKKDFPNFSIVQLEEVEVELQEGQYHNGIGKVIRFVGQKNK